MAQKHSLGKPEEGEHNHQSANNATTDPHRGGSAWTITHMPSNIAEYAIDTPVNFDAKADDILRHDQDESYDMFQRALLCLQSEEVNQKVFAAQNLFEMILEDENRAFQEIIPVMEVDLKRNLDREYHDAASTSMNKAIQALLAKNPQRVKQLLEIAVSLASSEDTDVSDAWYQCFNILVDFLNSADLQRVIVPQIIEKFGQQSSSVNSKRVAAKILSKLAKKIPEEVVSKRLLPTVESLFQDKEAIVRGTMCGHLPEIIVRLKDKSRIFLLLNNFLCETDPALMTALVGAFGRTVTLMSLKDPQANTFFQTAIPVIKKLVKKAYQDGNSNLLTEFTTHMGQMTSIFSSNEVLSDGDELWFLDAYLQLSRYRLPLMYHRGKGPDMPTGFANFRANIMESNKRQSLIEALISSGASGGNEGTRMSTTLAPKGNINVNGNKVNQNQGLRNSVQGIEYEDGWTCRANAASGFLHFLKFAKPLVDFRNGLHPMIVDLIHDPVPAVRAKMAENIYPIMQHLGAEGAHLHGEVLYALCDDNITVIEAIISNLADILKIFVQSKLLSPDNMTNAMVEIGRALLFCEERLSQTNNWRVHSAMLEQMSILPFVLPCDYVYNSFVPALFHRLLHTRQLPSRLAAANAIVYFLRHCRRSNQRENFREKIKEAFAKGPSVHDRMLFLFISKKIMETFSRNYYRDHFFETTLALTDDNVAIVRLKSVNMIPDLKEVLQMSEDLSLLAKLEETLTRIKSSETDINVQKAIEIAASEVEKIVVVLKKDSTGSKTKEDLEDEVKEREEYYIASLEQGLAAPTTHSRNSRKSQDDKTIKRHSDPPKLPVPLPSPTLTQTQTNTALNPINVQVNATPLTDSKHMTLEMKGDTFSKHPKPHVPMRNSKGKPEPNRFSRKSRKSDGKQETPGFARKSDGQQETSGFARKSDGKQATSGFARQSDKKTELVEKYNINPGASAINTEVTLSKRKEKPEVPATVNRNKSVRNI